MAFFNGGGGSGSSGSSSAVGQEGGVSLGSDLVPLSQQPEQPPPLMMLPQEQQQQPQSQQQAPPPQQPFPQQQQQQQQQPAVELLPQSLQQQLQRQLQLLPAQSPAQQAAGGLLAAGPDGAPAPFFAQAAPPPLALASNAPASSPSRAVGDIATGPELPLLVEENGGGRLRSLTPAAYTALSTGGPESLREGEVWTGQRWAPVRAGQVWTGARWAPVEESRVWDGGMWRPLASQPTRPFAPGEQPLPVPVPLFG
jgi:hypothetical protein